MAERDSSGRFAKGNNMNPGGRPKEVAEIRALCRQWAPEAAQTIYDIMTDIEVPAKTRLSAAQALLDRGFGRPPQAITDGEGGALVIQVVKEISEGEG